MIMLPSVTLFSQEAVNLGEITRSEEHVFVVTNRQLVSSSDNQLVFEPRPSSIISHHYFIAQEKEGSWIYSPQSSLQELLNNDWRYQDLLVFIHGDGKDLQSAVERAFEVQQLYKVNVLVYAWPSRDPSLGAIANYKNSRQNIESSTATMADFLESLRKFSEESQQLQQQKLTLFLHSLGNYYLETLVQEGYADHFSDPFVDNLILNAAAVEQKGHAKWLEKVHFGKRVIVNSNDDDISLTGLRVLTKLGRQLGESAGEDLAGNATYVDFTSIVGFRGMGPSHSYYFAEKIVKISEVKDFYSKLFHGDAPQDSTNNILLTHHDENPGD